MQLQAPPETKLQKITRIAGETVWIIATSVTIIALPVYIAVKFA